MGKVKGTGVSTVRQFISEIYGNQGLQKLCEALLPKDRHVFEQPVKAVSWVDFSYYMRMIVVADQVLGKGDFQIVEQAARYNMRENYNGIFKIFANVLSPKFIINKSNTMWQQWFDSGWMKHVWINENHAQLILLEFEDMPPFHGYNLTPSIDEILKITGGKNTSCQHNQCVLKGDEVCCWDVKWQ